VQDAHSRTPLHVAAHFGPSRGRAGAAQGRRNPSGSIAEIRHPSRGDNDVPMLKLALAAAATRGHHQPISGPALIAAAHLGHAEVVRVLVAAGPTARSRQQSRLDRADGVDHARQWGKAHTTRWRRWSSQGEREYRRPAGITPLGTRRRAVCEMVRVLERRGRSSQRRLAASNTPRARDQDRARDAIGDQLARPRPRHAGARRTAPDRIADDREIQKVAASSQSCACRPRHWTKLRQEGRLKDQVFDWRRRPPGRARNARCGDNGCGG